MPAKIVLCFILIAMLSMVSTSPHPYSNGKSFEDIFTKQEPKESGKVNVITLDSEKLEAIYYSSESSGIHIMSEVSGDEYHLYVRNLEGVILVSADHPDQTASTITIMGHQFLILNNTISETERYLTGYAVPATFSRKLKRALKKKHLNLKVLRHLDFEGANNSRSLAIEELLTRPEVIMIQDAAEALGNLRIMGDENPAAMSFYMLAMRLSNFLDHHSDVDEHEIAPREKRGHCSRSKRHCTNNGRCCSRCPGEDNCLGMCGRGCRCWYWVCRTCCYHQTCNAHDICCRNNPNSWGCLVPLGFSCRSGYTCYSDRTVPWRG